MTETGACIPGPCWSPGGRRVLVTGASLRRNDGKPDEVDRGGGPDETHRGDRADRLHHRWCRDRIRTDRGADTEDFLRGLYAFTHCEAAIDANLLVISDGHPRVMNVTEMVRHSTNRLLEILEAELKIEEADLRTKLRARRLEQVFIENRVYKTIEDIEDIDGVYAAVREAIGKFTPVSTTARALDRGMNELNRSAPEIRDAARSLLTTIFRSLAFEQYGPSREMIARNLDAIGHGPMQHQQVVKSLLSAIRHELTTSGRMAAVEDIITVDNLTREDMDPAPGHPDFTYLQVRYRPRRGGDAGDRGAASYGAASPAPPDGLRR